MYPENKINEFVRTREKWILKHVFKAKKLPRKRRDRIYVGGRYFKLVIMLSMVENLKIIGEKIIVSAKNKRLAKDIINKYLLDLTKQKVNNFITKYQRRFNLKNQRIIYKFYKSKWGSCSAKNALSFNAVLSMAPDEIIEYVLIHELVHLKIKNHGRVFWREVERYDSEYKKHRKWLTQNRDMLKT